MPPSAAADGALSPRGWHPGLLAAGAVVAALGIYATWSGWADLVWLAWNDPESSHILLVPVVAAWLFWIRRHRLAGLRPGFSLLGPAFVAAGWGVWEYGYIHSLRVAEHIAAVLVLLGVVVSITGHRVFWRFLPVFGVWLFLIPVPYRIRMPLSIPLQRWTAAITQEVMQTLGVEVTRAGSILTINGIDVGVAEACNGMRLVFGLFLVSYLFAFMLPFRPWVRVAILALAPLLALICNIIRLVPTVWFYGNTPVDVADAFHDLSGWPMIGLGFLILLGLLNLFRWMAVPLERSGSPAVPAAQP